jgi:hypothetical protein
MSCIVVAQESELMYFQGASLSMPQGPKTVLRALLPQLQRAE